MWAKLVAWEISENFSGNTESAGSSCYHGPIMFVENSLCAVCNCYAGGIGCGRPAIHREPIAHERACGSGPFRPLFCAAERYR